MSVTFCSSQFDPETHLVFWVRKLTIEMAILTRVHFDVFWWISRICFEPFDFLALSLKKVLKMKEIGILTFRLRLRLARYERLQRGKWRFISISFLEPSLADVDELDGVVDLLPLRHGRGSLPEQSSATLCLLSTWNCLITFHFITLHVWIMIKFWK